MAGGEASRGVEQERNRLAALMSELTQSVLVCNLDGRILLYNSRARRATAALRAAAGAGGAELVGLGRSIYGLFDRARWRMRSRRCSTDRPRQRVALVARFVTGTQAGHLLRVQLAPVRDGDRGAERTRRAAARRHHRDVTGQPARRSCAS